MFACVCAVNLAPHGMPCSSTPRFRRDTNPFERHPRRKSTVVTKLHRGVNLLILYPCLPLGMKSPCQSGAQAKDWLFRDENRIVREFFMPSAA